jgi:hypothetical protein
MSRSTFLKGSQVRFRHRRIRPSSYSNRQRHFCRLHVEPLEDRQLLSITVDTLADGLGVPGISLREAIADATAGEVIDISVTGTINLDRSLGDLVINKSLTIDGPGANLLTIDAGDGDDGVFNTRDGIRVFRIDDGNSSNLANVEISGLTLTGGDLDWYSWGGAILSTENLTVTTCSISHNAASSGGGIFNDYGKLTVDSSTIVDNWASSPGGGIYTRSERWSGAPPATSTLIVSCTISGNQVGSYGGGLCNASGLTQISFSTITANTAPNGSGSGVSSSYNTAWQARTEFYSTIVAGNVHSDVDRGSVSEPSSVVSTGYNLIGTGNALDAFSPTTHDLEGITDPLLAPLADYGGPTLTHALLPGSQAIDAGDPFFHPTASGVLFDQRGAPFTRVVESIPAETNDYVGLSEIKFGSSMGDVITPIAAFASTYYDATHSASKLIDNSSLDTSSGDVLMYTHAPHDLAFGMWHAGAGQGIQGAAPVVADQYVVLDLGANYDLSQVYLWQMVQTGLLGRGIKEFRLLASPEVPDPGDVSNPPAQYDLTGYTEILGITRLAASGQAVPGTTQAFALSGAADVRSIYIDIVSDYYTAARIDIGAFERQRVDDLSLVVDTLVDEFDGNFSAGDLSLREAILRADANQGPDTITFAPSLSGGSILLYGGELDIRDGVTIDARPLDEKVTISGRFESRIFNIIASAEDVSLSGLHLWFGHSSAAGDAGRGGAIRSVTAGVLRLDEMIVEMNYTTASDADGGGVFAQGPLVLINSTVGDNWTNESNAQGGGIFAASSVEVSNSTIEGNYTYGENSFGGGIYAAGALSMDESTVRGNYTWGTEGDGGGMHVGELTLENSTVSNNYTQGASADAGGILVFGGNAWIEQSTISGNYTAGSGSDGGGILFMYANAGFIQSTITDNQARHSTARGGGIYQFDSTANLDVTLDGSIVSHNTAGVASTKDIRKDPNAGSVLTINYSLIGTGFPAYTGAHNVVTDTPGLGPLANNGGPTLTHALLPGSLAIDAGFPMAKGLFDQRGEPYARVRNGDGIAGAVIDIGAFEVQAYVALPGDYNRNDVVDAADYVLWRKTLGTTGIPPYSGADGSGNGQIGPEDYGVWTAHFGELYPTGAGDVAATDFAESVDNLNLVEEMDGARDAVLLPWQAGVASGLATGPRREGASSGTSPTSARNVTHDDALIAWLASTSTVRNEETWTGTLANKSADAEEFVSLLDAPPSLTGALDQVFAQLSISG